MNLAGCFVQGLVAPGELFFFFFSAVKLETASEIVKQIFKLSRKQEKSVPERLPALMNTSWFITLGAAHRIVSLLRRPVAVAVNTPLPLLLSGLNFVSQVPHSALRAPQSDDTRREAEAEIESGSLLCSCPTLSSHRYISPGPRCEARCQVLMKKTSL